MKVLIFLIIFYIYFKIKINQKEHCSWLPSPIFILDILFLLLCCYMSIETFGISVMIWLVFILCLQEYKLKRTMNSRK